MSTLREWFNSIDKDQNGVVDAHELQAVLAKGNLHFSLCFVAQMIRLFSRTWKTQLDYEEFKNLHSVLEQSQRAFIEADTKKVGKLYFDTVAYILKSAGYRLDREVFTRLMQVFDYDGGQVLDLTAFIRLTMLLRGAQATFRAYDPQMSGTITLDFNQFLYVTANIA